MQCWKSIGLLQPYCSCDFSGMNSLFGHAPGPVSRAAPRRTSRVLLTLTFSTLHAGTSDWMFPSECSGWCQHPAKSKAAERHKVTLDTAVLPWWCILAFGSECQLLVRVSWNEGSTNCKLLWLISNYGLHWEALGRQSNKALKPPLICKERPLDWDCLSSQTSPEVLVSRPVLSPDIHLIFWSDLGSWEFKVDWKSAGNKLLNHCCTSKSLLSWTAAAAVPHPCCN